MTGASCHGEGASSVIFLSVLPLARLTTSSISVGTSVAVTPLLSLTLCVRGSLSGVRSHGFTWFGLLFYVWCPRVLTRRWVVSALCPPLGGSPSFSGVGTIPPMAGVTLKAGRTVVRVSG